MFKKSTKRVVSLILTALLTFSTTSLQTIAREVLPGSSKYQQFDKTFYGFKLEKKLNYKNNTEIYYFIHEKSGAHAVVEKNSNKKKDFCVGFRTPVENDKGTNHIIEHCILNGSKKYPCKNMIFELLNLSKTDPYLNAYTSPTHTYFPISCLSENELETLAKIYTDGIFNPNFLTDEKIFKKEGIRYELEQNDSLTANGTVFNEMQDDKSDYIPLLLKRLFPDTNSKNYFGGIPDKIMDLTYEEVCSTYKKYYHPSNCLIYLSGDINYGHFFEWLDKEYLNNYDVKDMSYIKYDYQNPDNLPIYEKIDVYSGDYTNSIIQIDYLLPWDFFNNNYSTIINIVKTINSDLKILNLAKEKEYAHIYCSSHSYYFTPILTFAFQTSREKQKCFEKKYVQDALKEILSAVTSSEAISNQKKVYKFQCEKEEAFDPKDQKIGYKNFMESFVKFGSPLSNSFFDINKNNVSFKSSEKTAKDLTKEILDLKPIITYLNYSSDSYLSTAKKIKNKCKYLESKKEELTRNYKEQQSWANSPNNKENINDLKNMFNDYSDVNTKINIPKFEKSMISGKNYYYCPTENLNDFFQLKFAFKVNHLNDKDKKYLPFLNKYLQMLIKKNLSYLAEIKLINRPVINNNLKDDYKIFNIITSQKNFSEMSEKLNTILSFKNSLDKDIIRNSAQEFINDYKSPLGKKMLKLSTIINAKNSEDPEEIIKKQYEFYSKIVNNINDDTYAQNFSEKLKALCNKIFNINTLQNAGATSSSKTKQDCKNAIVLFINSLSKEPISENTPHKLINSKKADNSIAVIDKSFSNNILQMYTYCPELCDDARFNCLLEPINKFLIFNIREKGGAYSTGIGIDNYYIVMGSHFDPNIDSTIDTFNCVPQFLKEHSFTQEDIKNMYIKKLISNYSKNKLSFINEKLTGLMLFGDIYHYYEKNLEKDLQSIKTMNSNDIKLLGEKMGKHLPDAKLIVFTANNLKKVKTKFDIIIS